MDPKVAIITTIYLKEYIQQVINLLPEAKEFEVHYYTDFNNVIDVYKNLPSYIKAIVTTGSYPQRILELTFPECTRIKRNFNTDNAGVYKLFMEILNENRDISLDRIYFDVFEIIGIKPDSYEEFLLQPQGKDISDIQNNVIAQMSLDALLTCENDYAQKHINFYKEGKYDIFITRFSSIVSRLRDASLNVRFAFPDHFFVKEVLHAALADVKLEEFAQNMPSAIFVTAKPIKKTGGAEEKAIKKLKTALKAFCLATDSTLVLQQKQKGIEIMTTKKVIKQITDEFNSCKLSSFLAEKLNFKVNVGYGIGYNTYQARINAIDANSSANSTSSKTGCLITEEDQLITRLGQKNVFVVSLEYSDEVKKIAKISGISCINIQKIMAVVKLLPNEYITSDILAHNLAITKRSANRFLNSLKNANIAKIVEQQQSATKGRPTYIYEINFDIAFTK